MAISKWPYRAPGYKDPEARLDYEIDWSDWLSESETIVTSVWVVEGGVIEEEANTATSATAWVSGGIDGGMISVTNTITTNSVPLSRIDERTLIIRVKNQ